MMRQLTVICVALTMAWCAAAAQGVELSSGPQPGEVVGAFEVKKLAGNDQDGVEVGQELCYRCKLGNRPVVMVFSRKADQSLAKLVKELDGVVAQNESKNQMASFVNLLGSNEDTLASAAKQLVDQSKAAHVAVVVPNDQPNGPDSYKINPEVETTVLIYVKGKVEANHALPAGALNDQAIEKIVADTSKIVK